MEQVEDELVKLRKREAKRAQQAADVAAAAGAAVASPAVASPGGTHRSLREQYSLRLPANGSESRARRWFRTFVAGIDWGLPYVTELFLMLKRLIDLDWAAQVRAAAGRERPPEAAGVAGRPGPAPGQRPPPR
eukprot:COSAG05_NODE_881_length_6789_cov_21.387743_5_plen_133_part_00